MGIRAAVIGVGHMGRHHVRILQGMQDISKLYLVDPNEERTRPFASLDKVHPVPSIETLPEIDIAVIAAPSEDHHALACALIEHGVGGLLVEKPLAHSVEAGEDLVRKAREAGITLGVGHVERFNPVMRFLGGISLQPKLIEIQRLSPYTPRISLSVVSDLMVHDLDLVCTLMGGATPTRIEAVGTQVFSDTIDVASAILEFEGLTIATIVSSRATQDKVRTISITEADRFIVADCLRQDISIKKETSVEFGQDHGALYRQANVTEIPYFDRSGEPLAHELQDFVDAYTSGREPAVSGEDGLRAIRLVEAVHASIAAR